MILQIKDGQGNWVSVPAIKGDPGEATPEFIAKYNEAMQAMTDLLAMLGTDIATLVGGKIPISQLPAIALHEIYTIESEDDLTSVAAQQFDIAAIVEGVGHNKKVVKSFQLLGTLASVRSDWVELGVDYASTSGYAATAGEAENANTINNKRIVAMSESAFDVAVKDPNTWYGVYPDEEE